MTLVWLLLIAAALAAGLAGGYTASELRIAPEWGGREQRWRDQWEAREDAWERELLDIAIGHGAALTELREERDTAVAERDAHWLAVVARWAAWNADLVDEVEELRARGPVVAYAAAASEVLDYVQAFFGDLGLTAARPVLAFDGATACPSQYACHVSAYSRRGSGPWVETASTIHLNDAPPGWHTLVAVVAHEYVHALDGRAGGAPAWWREGLAEYGERLIFGPVDCPAIDAADPLPLTTEDVVRDGWRAYRRSLAEVCALVPDDAAWVDAVQGTADGSRPWEP